MYWETFYYRDNFTLLHLVATPSSFLQLHVCQLSGDVTLQKPDLDSILVFQPHSGFLARDSARPFIQRPGQPIKKNTSFKLVFRPVSVYFSDTGPANMVAAPGA